MSDMLLEVDEALRAQQIKALWDRYGQWVIALAILVVIGSGIGAAWHNRMNQKLEEQTAALVAALQGEGDSQAVSKKLEALKDKTVSPLNGIVALYEAQTLEKSGNLEAARKSYQHIASQLRQPRIIKELAILQDVRLGILSKDNPNALLPKLENLTADNAPFRASALEMKGLLLQQQGKTEQADKIFEALSVDMNVPASLRLRAKALIRHEAGNAK